MAWQLVFQDVVLGAIHDVSTDFPWLVGRFVATEAGRAFEPMFAFMTDEARADEDPPFSLELLEDENWFVVDERGQRRAISLPAVHPDGEIAFRLRNSSSSDRDAESLS